MSRQWQVTWTRGEAQCKAEHRGGGCRADTRKAGGDGEEGGDSERKPWWLTQGGEERKYSESTAHEGLRHPLQSQAWGHLYHTGFPKSHPSYCLKKKKKTATKSSLPLNKATVRVLQMLHTAWEGLGGQAAPRPVRRRAGTVTPPSQREDLHWFCQKAQQERGWTLPQAGSAGRSFIRQPGAVSHFTEQQSVWPPKAEKGALIHGPGFGFTDNGFLWFFSRVGGSSNSLMRCYRVVCDK